MTEGRIILLVFGTVALIMIGLPIGMIMSAPAPVPPAKALDGAIAQFFLAPDHASAPGVKRQVLPGITEVLPAGMPAQAVFDMMGASGFTCIPDANSATCSRAQDGIASCAQQWRVSVIFDAGDKLKLSEADRRITCL